jgi:hypothetical protein
MYAIVHPSCAPHSAPLIKLGYKLLVQDHPVKKEDIKGEWLRNHIEEENCCGSAEFIKLYGEFDMLGFFYHSSTIAQVTLSLAMRRTISLLHCVVFFSNHTRT